MCWQSLETSFSLFCHLDADSTSPAVLWGKEGDYQGHHGAWDQAETWVFERRRAGCQREWEVQANH